MKLKPIEIFYWGELINSKHFHRVAHFIFFDLHCQVLGGEVKLEKKDLSDFIWISPKDALKLELGEDYEKVIKQFIKYKND